jgi:hypothetical protein
MPTSGRLDDGVARYARQVPGRAMEETDYGKRFDNVKMAFMRDHVAPLIMRNPAR